MINPDDFIISRKRKKYKFAKFANSPICFEFEEWDKQAVDAVEIGAGNGLFSVELAARHPDRHYVALDVKGDRLQKGAYEAEARGLTNIRFVRARADQVGELFAANSLAALWVTFPDPFLRRRSAGRRLTHPKFLAEYHKLLATDGSLYLKHDNREFFHWSLEQLVADRWHIEELSFDLHDSELSDDYKIQTTYEQRWLSEGLMTNFVKACKR